MANAKKAPAKKAKVKEPAKPLWMWCENGESYGNTFASREAAVKSAKEHVQDLYSSSWSKPKKPPTILIFQQVEEVQFAVNIEEIPVTKFKITVV